MKNVVITGASSGIGRAVAHRLAARGYKLALLARRARELDEVASAARRVGGDPMVFAVDVTDQPAVEKAIGTLVETWGSIDVVIANAGIRQEGRIEHAGIEGLRQTLETNLFGSVAVALAAVPSMEARGGGHIIFMNSLDGRWPNRLEGTYVASKHALLGFAGVARKELGDLGISVTSILPGRVDTPMIGHLTVPAVQPKMSADKVARAVERAMERRPAEIVIPAFRGRVLMLAGVLFPRSADRIADLLRIEGWPE